MKYILIISFMLIGCGSTSAVGPEGKVTDVTAPKEEFAMECNDDAGNTLTCNTSSDCCEGFYCGKDPDKEQRHSYCLYDPTNYRGPKKGTVETK